MKKFFTLIMTVACSALTAWATDYTVPVTVAINGAEMDGGNATLSVTEEDGSTTLSLMNFSLGGLGVVGDIILPDVETVQCGSTQSLHSQKTIKITSDDPSAMGPKLGDVPVLMNAEIKGGKFNAILAINMVSLGYVVGVKLGDAPNNIGHIANGDFTKYHDVSCKYLFKTYNSVEPNAWHSFMTATGNLAGSVNYLTRVEKCADNHAGKDDDYSVKISSNVVLSISANGTITTGRLAATSMNAEENYSYLDMNSTDVDSNGDPYYTVLTGKPDAVKIWVKYHVGARDDKNKDNVFALASAYITDENVFHDPDGAYKNYVASANQKIGSNNDAWQELTIPFVPNENATVSPKALLVTLSTCAVPAGGSKTSDDPDVLYVDDIKLVYNAELSSLKFKNQELTLDKDNFATVTLGDDETFTDADISVTSNGVGAYVIVSPLTYDAKENTTQSVITVISNDLQTSNMYGLIVQGGKLVTTGVEKPSISGSKQVTGIYNLNGQRVNEQVKGQVYITKYADGSTVKTIGK